MQNTSADYKLEINKPSRTFECKVTIGDNIYTNEDIVDVILDYPQPSDGFTIGNTISQTLDLTLINRGDIIYSTSQVKLEIGLKIEDRIEYIPMGIFNIDDIEKTDYTTKFICYDNMIKFETPYFSELSDKPTLQQVVNELAKITGIQFEGSLPAYTVSKLGGFSCREVLSYVASICGGNALITRSGKFTIKGLSEVVKAINGDNYFDFKREEVKYKVGKISCQVDENSVLSKGSLGTDSMELSFENPWITEKILTELYNKLNGLSYLGYSMKWQGDLSLDPYDIITVTDIKNVTRNIPILSQKLTYTGGLTSEIEAKGESKNKNSFSSSGSTTNKINRLVTEQAVIKEALIEKANIKDLEAVSIKTQTLEAKTAKIEEAIIDVAYIKDLNVINANIENLKAADATINNALIGKADITQLNAVQGNINTLNSQVANIETLVNGNLTSDNIHSLVLTSSKVTVENGFIKNAMIENLDVSKINAGTISTDKFLIKSADGGIEIRGATQQFKDKNNKVRLQLGKDSQGNFNFILRGEDGTSVLLDHTGLKAKAITDGLIVNNMLGQGAVTGDKVNIGSLIQEVNKDTNTSTIKATKIQLDKEGQSLDIAFNTLKTNVDNIEVGGTNLAIDTNKGKLGWNWSLASGGRTISEVIENNIKCCKLVRDSVDSTSWSYISYSHDRINREKYLPNKQYTISFEVKASVVTKFKVGIKEGGSLNPICNDRTTDNTVVNTWIKLSVTVTTLATLPTSKTQVLYLAGMNSSTGVSYIFRNLKIEEGNKATAWTAAPEDLESRIESNTTQIAAQQGKIEALISDTSIVEDGSTKKLKDAYANLKLTVNGLNSTVGSHTTNITNLQGQMSTANSNISNLSGKVQTVESKQVSFEQNLSGISQKVSSAESNITTLKGQMTTANNNITAVTNNLNNLQIGVSNLIRGTKEFKIDSNRINGFRNEGSYAISYSEADKCHIATAKASGLTSNSIKSLYSSFVPCKKGDKFTLSVWLKVKDINAWDLKYPFIFEVFSSNKSTRVQYQDVAITHSNSNRPTFINNTWVFFTYTDVVTADNAAFMGLRLSLFRNGEVSYKLAKVEIGTKATGWSPAPQDVENTINSVDSKITTTNNKVAELTTNLNGITQRVGTTESKTSILEKTTEKMLINNFSRSGIKDRWSSNIGTITASNAVGYYANVSTNGNAQVTSEKFEIDASKSYKISLMVQNPSENATGSWFFGVYAHDKDNNNIGVYVGTSTSLDTNAYFHQEQKANKNTTWRTFEGYIYSHNTVVNANTPKGNCINFMKFHPKTKYLVVRFLNYRSASYGNGQTGSIYFAHPTISVIDNRIVDTETRLKSAESKITSDAIINTVSSTINTAKQEAINSANSNTANQLKNYATTSSVTQTVNSWVAKFSSSGGSNLIKNSKVGQTSNLYGFGNRAVDMTLMQKGKKYTLTVNGKTVNGAGSRYLTVFIYNGDWTFSKSIVIKETVDTTRSVTFEVPSNISGNLMVSSYHYPNDGDRSGSSRINWYCLTEGEVPSLWMPHHGEVIDGSTQIDADGVTIKNGALRVQNKAGQIVLTGDSNGDLTLTGKVINGANGLVSYLDRGGLILEATNEKVGYIRSSSFASNRDINGLSIGALGKGDYVDIGYTTDNDLGSGTSLTPSIRIAKTNHSLIGSFVGIQLKDNTRIDYTKKLLFQNNTSYDSEIYANGSGHLNLYGDNGLMLGYKNGNSNVTALQIDESSDAIFFMSKLRDHKGGQSFEVLSRYKHGSVEKFAPRITNMNAYLDSGWYSFGTDCSGTPTGWGIMLTFRAFSTDMCQIVHGTNNVLYIRWYINGAYTSWKSW